VLTTVHSHVCTALFYSHKALQSMKEPQDHESGVYVFDVLSNLSVRSRETLGGIGDLLFSISINISLCKRSVFLAK